MSKTECPLQQSKDKDHGRIIQSKGGGLNLAFKPKWQNNAWSIKTEDRAPLNFFRK